MNNIPRSEHPKPQFMRKDWINLNGEWEFQFDENMCGKSKHYENEHLSGKIIVPFCPESRLSGIEDTDFHNCVWYRRNITIPKEWENKRVILHFGAVDYEATVYVNGREAGSHKGGYVSFSLDITDALREKENYISVCAEDDVRNSVQPSGKQSMKYDSWQCFYTRTTGIWQTVWLEAVNSIHLKSAKYYTDIENGGVDIRLSYEGHEPDVICRATASYNGEPMGKAETMLRGMSPSIYIDLKETHLWEVGNGRLYDLRLELIKDGKVIDTVDSYFGLRSIDLKEKEFCINNKSVFGRWVLDQGYYPEGIYTAPSDEALKNDILYGIQLGFNGARPHEKVFEERYLYWADKLGYLVWGEYPNWGFEPTDMTSINNFLPEWMEEMERDFNHPSIIGWCPFNETWDIKERGKEMDIPHCREIIETVYHITKVLDPTRPVIDTSGNYHTVTDIFDVHNYEQIPEKFAEDYADTSKGVICDTVSKSPQANRQTYKGEPIFVSEYGGIKWSSGGEGWGYGNGPKTEEEFVERYRKLTETLLFNKDIFAFCYTQLYDVEQEVNGLMTYDRKFKFDPEKIRRINIQKAAIED
ncbi:MAG: glycoside hydrolase family 2 TIM barrel-domain containing protein [Clostridia bacterium]|nr:glycoside hydrolase family 2 TIM barrel-domain containing protein [Clostridia bacterium]